MGAPLKYKSEVKPWSSTAGAQVEFTEFVEQRGPRGGRVVIDGFSLHFRGQIDVTVAALLGADVVRAFRTVTVEQKDGVRRYNEVPGDALRVFGFAHNGPDRQKEHADAGVANDVTYTWTLYVPMAKPYAKRPRDFSISADVLKSVKIGCASAAEMSLGTSVVNIDNGNYWVIAECHEEMDIVHHSIDEVIVREFETTTQSKLQIDGRCHDLYLYIRGAGGGLTLANLSEAWIEHLQPQALLLTPDLQEHYARSRASVTGLSTTQGNPVRSDPFITATIRAAAVLLCDGNKVYENPVRDTITVKTTQTAALGGALQSIVRIVRPRSERLSRALASKYGYQMTRPKTADKTKQAPKEWPDEYAAYLPAKAVKAR